VETTFVSWNQNRVSQCFIYIKTLQTQPNPEKTHTIISPTFYIIPFSQTDIIYTRIYYEYNGDHNFNPKSSFSNFLCLSLTVLSSCQHFILCFSPCVGDQRDHLWPRWQPTHCGMKDKEIWIFWSNYVKI